MTKFRAVFRVKRALVMKPTLTGALVLGSALALAGLQDAASHDPKAVLHDKKDHALTEKPVSKPFENVYQEINRKYLKSVRSIFRAKCFNCHSDQTKYPWYYRLPGVRQMIDHDIEEALEHLDLSKDFPFRGHASPERDLAALEDVVVSDEMPPRLYRLMHWGSGLSEDDKDIILSWIREGLDLLEDGEDLT